MLETLLNIGGGLLGMGGNIASIYSAISSIGTGKWQAELVDLLKQQNAELIKLNEHISYVPQATPVRVKDATQCALSLQDLRQLLEPLQHSLGQDIVSSAMFATPPLLQEQFRIDPASCLDGIKPLHSTVFDRGSDWVPLVFWDRDSPYVGWQKKGMLRAVLGLEFSGGLKAWAPQKDNSRAAERKEAGSGTSPRAKTPRAAKSVSNAAKTPRFPDFSQLKARAEGGDLAAQFLLGVSYDRGEGVGQNYQEAVRWWRKAAEQGHGEAQLNLSWMYEAGQGVEQDYKQAVAWCEKAAAQGNSTAQCNLGWMYEMGRGVKKDNRVAVKLYANAAAQGNKRALELLRRPGWADEK